MPHDRFPSRVTAVLGPTNTGKTHLAIARMLGHASGMIGFPLRLLARENYDRICAQRGPRTVALITGEEKIVPPHARYFLCTVESMPLERRVAFLAIDEIQLAGDPDRGHVFTDRLLHARGEEETMFLGAETIRPLIHRLVPEADFVTRPRFSTLAHAGTRKITRLPRRSAVVAFSAGDVYALAERLRRQRGGAAVVLGALSPRARNAQVGMFQNGEVDFLIATDAIGMGLNMDIGHVTFARLVKFDGRAPRPLTAAEIAQIAGRAGRHMSDGTFGTTTEAGPLDPEIVAAVEDHRFPPLTGLFWRNRQLDFASPRALLASLEAPPPAPGLVRAREADDHLALRALAGDGAVARRAVAPAAVRLLWQVCQIPDYRKVMSDAHARLLKRIYGHLIGPEGRLPEDWVAAQIARFERTDGDIDALAARIAHVRTWTFVAYRSDWLADPVHWQERSRAIEDRLSDALHQRLTQRFVDRRAVALMSRLEGGGALRAAVAGDGEVLVEGEAVGRLDGFRFHPDPEAGREVSKALVSAARRALHGEIAARLADLAGDGDAAFALDPEGRIAWRDMAVARLAPGRHPLGPRVVPLASEFLGPDQRARLCTRLAAWLDAHLAARLGPLLRAREAALSGPGRGVVFQLAESLGSLPRCRCEAEVAALDPAGTEALRRLGVRIGRHHVFLPALLKPAAVAARALLWAAHQAAHQGAHRGGAHRGMPAAPLPPPGAVSVPLAAEVPAAFYEAIGYQPFAGAGGTGRALRVDMVERLAGTAHRLGRQGSFVATPALKALAGCGPRDLAAVLAGLGFIVEEDASGLAFRPRPGFPMGARRARTGPGTPGKAVPGKAGPRKAGPQRGGPQRGGPGKSRPGTPGPGGRRQDSPFARLRELDLTP